MRFRENLAESGATFLEPAVVVVVVVIVVMVLAGNLDVHGWMVD